MSFCTNFSKEAGKKPPQSKLSRTKSSGLLLQKQDQFKKMHLSAASESELQLRIQDLETQSQENVFMSPTTPSPSIIPNFDEERLTDRQCSYHENSASYDDASAASSPLSPFCFVGVNQQPGRHSTYHTSSESYDENSLCSNKPSVSIDCDAAENSFCEKVMEHAKEMAGETLDPIDLEHSINKVPVELLEGHGTPHGNSFGERRTTVSSFLQGNVKAEAIFDLAEKNAEREAKKKGLSVKDTQKHICKHGNRVLITGQAGIGKSTLSRTICQKIIDKKMLPNMRYVFYIKCRDIDFDEKLDLFEFLSKYGVSDDQDFQPDEKKHIIKTIDESSQVIIIFDGMDEAQTDDLSKSDLPKCRLKDVARPSVILRSLMSGNLLPNAKILVTCRPRQAYRFSPEYRPGAVVQILGLNVESQQKLGKQICKDNFSSTYSIIRKDEDLESACYISVFCVILYAVLNNTNKDQRRSGKFQLSSITTVLVYLLDRYFRSAHMRNVKLSELKKIAELARKGFTKRRLIFDPNIIGEVGLTQAALQAFTVTYVDADTKLRLRIFGPEERCCFSHFIWQEFLTAIDLLFFAPAEVFDECLECITSNDEDQRWEVVAKFMYGLTNEDTFEYIQTHLISKASKTQWSKRKHLLWTSSQMCVNRPVQDSFRLVQVCNWLQEVDDYSFTEKLVSKFPETFKLSGSDSPLILLHHDVCSILRLLRAEMDYSEQSRKIKNIDCENVHFTRDTFRNFASNMSNRNGKIQEIRLNSCELGKSPGTQIIRFMNKVERFHISYCNLTEGDLLLIKQQYEKLCDPKPEVWVFLENAPPCDVGEELRRSIIDKKQQVHHSRIHSSIV